MLRGNTGSSLGQLQQCGGKIKGLSLDTHNTVGRNTGSSLEQSQQCGGKTGSSLGQAQQCGGEIQVLA